MTMKVSGHRISVSPKVKVYNLTSNPNYTFTAAHGAIADLVKQKRKSESCLGPRALSLKKTKGSESILDTKIE